MDIEPHSPDIGLIVGRYLQLLATISLASLILAPFFGALYFDLSFVLLFWAGSALVDHNPIARMIIMILSGMICLLATALIPIVLLLGTRGMTLTLGPLNTTNPPIGLAVSGLLLIVVLTAFPLYLLMTKDAVSQFADNTKKSR